MNSISRSWKTPLALLASIGATLIAIPLLAGPVPAGRPVALTNWQTALSSFKKMGALIGQEQYAQAKAELSAGTTNLSAPYGKMAGQFLARLESALRQASDPGDSRRRQTLAQLCAELRAYPAALRLSAAAGSAAAEDRDTPEFAWRLYEAGDVEAALREYKRKLAGEDVDMWQSHYREQIRLLEQRPVNLTNVQFAIQLVQEHYLKGYEEKADLFGALQELTRVLPFARDPKEGLMVHQRIIKCLVGLDDVAGRDAWEEKLLDDFKGDMEACAQVHLERGLRAMETQDFPHAMPLFRKVCAEYSNTEAYGDAQFSVGVVLQLQGKYDEAISEFARLFPSNVNDYALNPDNSEDCKNYRFRAALRISGCYEAKKDPAQALQYAELARDRYKFVSYCKTCMQDTRESLDKRIAQLKEALAKSP